MAERETVVDFTVPYYDLVGLSILMKKPEIKPSLFKFLTVLETNVWGCILAAYFFTSFLMFIFDRLSPYSYRFGSFDCDWFRNYRRLYPESIRDSLNVVVFLQEQQGKVQGRRRETRVHFEGVSVVLHDFIDSSRRRRSSAQPVRPSRSRNLVVVWIHHHCFVHCQLGRLPDCFPTRISH